MIYIPIFLTKIFNILFIFFILLIKKEKKKALSNFFFNNSNLKFNNYSKYDVNNEEYLNIIEIKYIFSFTFNIVKLEYKIGFYNDNNLILPSDLALYKNLRLICYIEIFIDKNITINSLPNICQNRYYKCLEYFKMNEKINFGFKLYKKNENQRSIIERKYNFFNEMIFNYNNFFYRNDSSFNYYIIIEKYKSKIKMMKNEKINKSLIVNLYTKYPYFILKRNAIINKNIWIYGKIFNDYFCFCKGITCLNSKKNYQKCKYYFYLRIIDLNKNLYNKTDFLFIDFIFSEFSSDDAYPVFKKMLYQNYPVHYITEDMEIYNEFCYKKKQCLSIIYVNKHNYTINGDFLEKYLTLILQLKQVISGQGTYFNFINNLFYDIEYITYISITHGVCYFKYFLYEDLACYGLKRINKIVIPPSDKVISLAKKSGWKDEDIIKMNLPKWDRYNNNNKLYLESKSSIKTNSIFIFFTWRDINKNKKISSLYYKNIISLLKSKPLIESSKKFNITLYFSFHHRIDFSIIVINLIKKYKYLQLIEENKISSCLLWANLVITDFSSIVFDFIYREKPFILYIPDIDDYNVNEIYNKKYSELIQSIKNGTIEFENLYLNINEAINKTLFYINCNFTIDLNLKIFYDKLNIKEVENNTDKFIQYIKNMN